MIRDVINKHTAQCVVVFIIFQCHYFLATLCMLPGVYDEKNDVDKHVLMLLGYLTSLFQIHGFSCVQ